MPVFPIAMPDPQPEPRLWVRVTITCSHSCTTYYGISTRAGTGTVGMKAPGVADAHRSHHSATAVLSWAVSQAPSTPPVAISSPPSCVSPLIQIASTTLSYADGRTGCIDLPALLSRPQRGLVSCKPGHLPPRRPRIAQFPTDSTSDTSNFSLTCSIHLRR